MFDQIFGNYLVSSGTITKEQFQDVLESEGKIRVKLGLIAVAEKLMTEEQADEVNKLQSIMDRRFGDIAVEKGYLSDDQVTQLLKKQGNIYMVFVQTLIDKGYMSLEDIDTALNKYQEDQGFTHSDMDALVSGDIDRTVKLFLPANAELSDKHCGIAIRTFIRIIDSSAYVSKAYFVDELKTDKLAIQSLQGDHKITSGFAGDKEDLLVLANKFAGEEFETVDMDALDAVGEFTNCINGLFASELSGENVDLDMLPPVFYENPVSVTGNQFCVFPIHVNEKEIKFVLSIDSDIEVK